MVLDDEAEASGPVRDESGRFAKTEQSSGGASSPKEAEGQPDEGTLDHSSEAAPTAGLPANWRPDMADIWQKMPEPERERLGKWSQELHGRMSDMGRQVSQLRDFVPLVEHMTQAFPDKFGPNGVPPVQGLAALVDAAYMLDRQPVQALLQLANESGVMGELAQALGAGGQGGNTVAMQATIQQLRNELAGLASPDRINQQIDYAMTVRDITSSVERFKAEKPLYAEVEADLPAYIDIAWSKRPEASPAEIHQLAYDMAVNADPAVRAKANAAAQKAAVVKPDIKAAAAKKAASINVTSTSSGKGRQMSEDEALDAAYDRAMAS
jgi:hypothetical protein